MRILVALFLLLASCGAAAAQGCGSQNPNCIVPTAPAGTSNNQAASTAFVQSAIGVSPTPGTAGNFPIYNNAGTGLKDSTVILAPVGGLTLYASPSGTGTQTCLSPANSCTLPNACLMQTKVATFLGTIGIQLADGTYTTGDISGNQCSIQGNAGGSSSVLAQISGNAVSPGNVVIAIQSGQNGFIVQDGGEAGINHLKITNVNGGGPGIIGRQIAIVDYNDIQWGTWGNSASHVAAYGKAVIINPKNETLLASTTFLIHWNITDGSMVIPAGTTTIQSSVSWSPFFAAVGNGGTLDTTGWTVSGTGTGPQFSGSGVGFLASASTPCASVFPGTGGCTLVQGFQTSAGDNPTSVVPAGGVSCPSGITAGTVTVVNGVVTHC